VPREHLDRRVVFGTDTLVSANYAALPMYLEPFAKWRDRLLIVDGLVNQQGMGGHGACDALSCVPGKLVSGAGYNHANAKTIDQHFASTMGRGMPFSSLHLGTSTEAHGAKVMPAPLFAKGPGQLMSMQLSPVDAFANIFPGGTGAAPAMAVEALKKDMAGRRKLFDHMVDDIKRVRARLAGSEQVKLDQYLSSVEEAQARLLTLQDGAGARGACGQAPTPAATLEAQLEAQVDVAAAALICGMTSVLTMSFHGIGRLRPDVGLHSIGHGDYPNSNELHDQFVVWNARVAAKLLQRLANVPEGTGTMLDNGVLAFLSDNNEQHHSRCWRVPVVLVGTAGGKLKANGRYIRYPARPRTRAALPDGGPANVRPLGDLWSAVSHALDAPVDDWGKAGLEKVQGPLAELL
jgi:hypothetical protein